MKMPLWCAVVCCALVGGAETVLYVDARQGSDANPGTAERPFATPARARDAVRALKKTGAFPSGGVAVELAGRFDTTKATILDLTKEDGGLSPAAPVIWRAAKGGATFKIGRASCRERV